MKLFCHNGKILMVQKMSLCKIYTTIQVWGQYKFLMFLNKDSSAHHDCIHLIKNASKNSDIVKYYNNLK